MKWIGSLISCTTTSGISALFSIPSRQRANQAERFAVDVPSNSPLACLNRAWQENSAELRGFLVHRSGNPSDGDDLLQELFLRAIQQGGDFCRPTNPRAWLFHVRIHEDEEGCRPILLLRFFMESVMIAKSARSMRLKQPTRRLSLA